MQISVRSAHRFGGHFRKTYSGCGGASPSSPCTGAGFKYRSSTNWWSRCAQIKSPNEYFLQVSCDTWLMDRLGCRIWYWHSFWHMFYCWFGTYNLIAMFIFKYNLRKDQCQVKLSQFRRNFQNVSFLLKTCLYCPVLSWDSKKCHSFLHATAKSAKSAFQKVTSTGLLRVLLVLAKRRLKLLLGTYALVLLVCSFMSYIPVLWILKILELVCVFIQNFEYRGSESEILKYYQRHFIEHSILLLLVIFIIVLI